MATKPASEKTKANKAKAKKPAAKRKNLGGRPSKFDTLNLRQVEILARRGWSDEEMAEFFGVGVSTWYYWKTQKPEFLEALKVWKENHDREVEKSLLQTAREGNTTAQIFWLKNRQPHRWRDVRDHNVSLDATALFSAIKAIDPEFAEQLRAELAKRRKKQR